MDLKDFIKETIASIATASSELQDELSDQEIIINPPVTSRDHDDSFVVGSAAQPRRSIISVQFDVAVTAASETTGEGGAKLKVWEIGVGAEGSHSRTSEQVSRIQFRVPMSLKPSREELEMLDRYTTSRNGGR